jgi:hypothetical protein
MYNHAVEGEAKPYMFYTENASSGEDYVFEFDEAKSHISRGCDPADLSTSLSERGGASI